MLGYCRGLLLLPLVNLRQKASKHVLLQTAALVNSIDLLVDLFIKASFIGSVLRWDVDLLEDLFAKCLALGVLAAVVVLRKSGSDLKTKEDYRSQGFGNSHQVSFFVQE